MSRPRLEPRMVFASILIAIPFLWLVASLLLSRPGADACPEPDHAQVGGVSQMFVPGDSCRDR